MVECLVKYAAIIKLGMTWLEVFTGHFIRVYKMLNQSNVVDMLQKWGVWLSRREDHGLGYKQSSFNLLGAAPSSGSKEALLPYGVDEDAVFGAIDRAVCALPEIPRLILKYEYMRAGGQEAKLKALGLSRNSYVMMLKAAHSKIEQTLFKQAA